MIKIRQAEYEDLIGLASIQIRSWRNAFNNILSDSTLNKYTYLDKCLKILENIYNSNKGYFYIASINENPCAELFWRKCTESEHAAEIVSLHSIPECWGQGVGKAIIDKATDDIFNSGLKTVYLWVFEQNKRARRFYEKCGFIADGATRISIYDNAAEVRYTLKKD